jgi:NAD(P)-dependent dehydrogenase (short-subunit alcohol dehydrogenase family)
MDVTKIAIITGASRGLGRSMALHLAEKGVDVLGTYHSNRKEADAVAAAIVNYGRHAHMVQLDAGKMSALTAFASALPATLQGAFGRDTFDFLINNAGTGMHAPFVETTEAQFDEMLALHLKAPFFLTQKLLPHMVDGGRILNVSSGLARFTYSGASAYASMKGGVEVLTRYMARELGERRITANVVAPGAIATDFGGGRVRDNAQINAAVAAAIPLGRVGLPDDVGAAVSALLSDDCAWINGTRIEVSGGQNL